jgi:hypothetical protein
MTRISQRLARAALLLILASPLAAQGTGGTDPRVGLKAGWMDAGEAIRNLQLVAHRPRPEGFFNAQNMGDFSLINGDLAFSGTLAFQGGYHGLQVWDLATPSNPVLKATLPCPGGQGDVSTWGNLLFVSVEENRGRVDCGTEAIADSVSTARFRGVRIFDVTDVTKPRQVAAVQTCRGSHTHTLVTDPKDPANVYVYVSGTSPVRPAQELAGCVGSETDPNTSLFRIEVIRVPLAAPQDARVVSMPRIFADAQGNVAGLNKGGKASEGAQETAQTNQCHDITVFPELGLAAGACAGNGILLDITNPAQPRRVDEVSDPNFAYWHSATFNNDGTKILFTDEWGGGVAPRCQASDRKEWGADAIFTLNGRALPDQPAGYYKLPAAQTATENCVAHNGSLIPVPGRDIMVQAWYQGGLSVFDFTDPAKPVEIAFFDRGPMSDTTVAISGYWSAYWYNGYIVGSEIGRGLDVFQLTASDMLTQNEIDAAKLVRMDRFNPQLQSRMRWPASFVVARAYLDQLARTDGLAPGRRTAVAAQLAAAERQQGARRRSALAQLATALERDARNSSDAAKVRLLAGAVRGLAR